MTIGVSEAEWELIALDVLAQEEWRPVPGADVAPGTPRGRESWAELVMPQRLFDALTRLNPGVPPEQLTRALADVTATRSQDAITESHRAHGFLVDGYRGVTYLDRDGVEQTPTIRLIGDRVEDNEWLAVNQVTVGAGDVHRRFDVVLYLNGLPVAIIELKKAGSLRADVATAHVQLRHYVRDLPMAFRFCAVVVASDGTFARYGTPFTPYEHLSPWNVDGDGRPVAIHEVLDDVHLGTELELLVEGVFNPERFLQLQRSFTAYDEGAGGLGMRIAKPHQYFAVTKAVASTIEAVRSHGKAGVVWHTQGSGKSMEMELYTNLVLRRPELRNPTVVVVTDRKELDGQLYDGFARSLLLPERPVLVTRREQLREELAGRTTGGIYFTTLQKFGLSKAEKDAGLDHPRLSDRRNVIVMVDEAHRSHYDDLDGYARHLADALPHATLIAFTGTPISFAERDTRKVFGDYIDVYDLSRAVADGATVPVLFEPRLVKVALAEGVTEALLDAAADEATVGLDEVERARLEKAVTVINAVYGAPERLRALAADIVSHWENRSTQVERFIDAPGKAMIVGATREICARLYDAIVELRPDWHADALDRGRIKVVYSGSPRDEGPVLRHVRREADNKVVKQRLRDVDDELELVIVKDMMLTGYDSPPLHTLYLDRPLKGALLMQTLARVNRTFRGKDSGLLVGYAPLSDNLNAALAEYSATDQAERPIGRDIQEVAGLTVGLIGQLDDLTAAYDWRGRLGTGGARPWIQTTTGLMNWLRSPTTPGNEPHAEPSLRDRFRALSNQLSRAWAVSSGSQTLAELMPAARFYEDVRIVSAKYDAMERQANGEPIPADVQRLLAQLVATSTGSGEIVDIYAAAGIPKPTLDDLTPAYVEQAQASPTPHLAVEALRAALTEEAGHATRSNVARRRAFSERLTELMRRYTNSQLTAAEVIAELAELAKDIAAEASRGQRFQPPLAADELAVYDALAVDDPTLPLQSDDVLAQIARELVTVMRRDVKTDWTVRDDVRAKLRASIRRLLVTHRYPAARQAEAIRLVFEQMETMTLGMAA